MPVQWQMQSRRPTTYSIMDFSVSPTAGIVCWVKRLWRRLWRRAFVHVQVKTVTMQVITSKILLSQWFIKGHQHYSISKYEGHWKVTIKSSPKYRQTPLKGSKINFNNTVSANVKFDIPVISQIPRSCSLGRLCDEKRMSPPKICLMYLWYIYNSPTFNQHNNKLLQMAPPVLQPPDHPDPGTSYQDLAKTVSKTVLKPFSTNLPCSSVTQHISVLYTYTDDIMSSNY